MDYYVIYHHHYILINDLSSVFDRIERHISDIIDKLKNSKGYRQKFMD